MQPQNKREFRTIESDLRNLDPLETTEALYDDHDLVRNLTEDIVRVDDMLAADKTLSPLETHQLHEMGCNMRLDWLYAKHGGQAADATEFLAKAKEAESFFEKSLSFAESRSERHPQDGWGLAIKQLDLRSVVLYRFARESQTTQKDSPASVPMWQASENMSRSVLNDSVKLMKQMAAVSEGHSDVAQDARGTIYELMLLTYARLKLSENQDLDTTFVRSALSREDRPWNGHVLPKRSFDMLIEKEGQAPQLLQAKNYDNGDEYEKPIQKVQDTHFKSTLNELPTYLRDFSLLVENSADEHLKERINLAGNRLDNVFGQQLAQKIAA